MSSRGTARLLLQEGLTALRAGYLDAAEMSFQRALSAIGPSADVTLEADLIFNLGTVAWHRPDLRVAHNRYQDARNRYADANAWYGVAVAEMHLGNVAYQRGEMHRARWYFTRACIAFTSTPDHRVAAADCRVNLSAALVELGDAGAALREVNLAAEVYRELSGDERTRKLAEVDQNTALALLALGDIAQARTRLDAARRAFEALGDHTKLADIDHNLGDVSRRAGEVALAKDCYRRAEETYRAQGREVERAD